MVREAEEALRGIIQELPEGDPQRGILLPHLRAIEIQAQLAYLDFDKFPKTEAEVKEELARQADEYIKFGLNRHPQIKMARGKFKDSMIALARPQSETLGGRVDISVGVLGQVAPSDVYKAAGVGYYLKGLDVRDWPDDPQGYETPQRLYLTWMDTGIGNLDKKVQDVRSGLLSDTDMRGATEADGSGLYVAHPGILKHHCIEFPGTSVGSGYAPYLRLFHDGPEVYGRWVDSAHPGWGSALCGRN